MINSRTTNRIYPFRKKKPDRFKYCESFRCNLFVGFNIRCIAHVYMYMYMYIYSMCTQICMIKNRLLFPPPPTPHPHMYA